MSFTFDLAAPGKIIGRVVGEARQHIAVAVREAEFPRGCGVLVAVKRDGSEYVTWRYGPTMSDTGVNVWRGHFFPCPPTGGGSGDAFDRACSDMDCRMIEDS